MRWHGLAAMTLPSGSAILILRVFDWYTVPTTTPVRPLYIAPCSLRPLSVTMVPNVNSGMALLIGSVWAGVTSPHLASLVLLWAQHLETRYLYSSWARYLYMLLGAGGTTTRRRAILEYELLADGLGIRLRTSVDNDC